MLSYFKIKEQWYYIYLDIPESIYMYVDIHRDGDVIVVLKGIENNQKLWLIPYPLHIANIVSRLYN